MSVHSNNRKVYHDMGRIILQTHGVYLWTDKQEAGIIGV